jgi:hypothetical protein
VVNGSCDNNNWPRSWENILANTRGGYVPRTRCVDLCRLQLLVVSVRDNIFFGHSSELNQH